MLFILEAELYSRQEIESKSRLDQLWQMCVKYNTELKNIYPNAKIFTFTEMPKASSNLEIKFLALNTEERPTYYKSQGIRYPEQSLYAITQLLNTLDLNNLIDEKNISSLLWNILYYNEIYAQT